MYAMSDYEKRTTQKYGNLRSNMVSPLSLRILIFRHEVCCTVALPSFIWLRVGNCSVRSIEELLRKHSATIHTFGIVQGEYVTFVDDVMVASNRPGALYDDIYERTASGFSIGGQYTLYRQTGERFSKAERRSAIVGIVREFEESAEEDGDAGHWCLAFAKARPYAIDVSIEDSKVFRECRRPRHWTWESAMKEEYPVFHV